MRYQVVVPVYNGEDTIADCLASIVGQEGAAVGEDFCVLVVDDGSSDRTAEIAGRFPVKIVTHAENRGRVEARLTGAKKARCGRLVFLDARVTIPPDFIKKLDRFESFPAVMGESSVPESQAGWDRLFYLIRRRYYGKKNFPMKEDELLITPENFKRAPKGTTFLLVDRDLFIRCLPERNAKDTSDDTLLLYNMVHREGVNLLRAKAITISYNPTRTFKQFRKWLFHRGKLFSDFYLTSGGYFSKHFAAGLKVMIAALAAGAILSVAVPWFATAVLAALLAGYLLACGYLSEKPGDFLTCFVTLAPVAAIFGAGVAHYCSRYFWNGMRKKSLLKQADGYRR